MDKPICKVHGMLAPQAMCGHVLVGLKYCGFSGNCEHKSTAEMIVKLVKDAATNQGDQQ